MLGEMAGETILASQRLVPSRLLATGYAFRWPALEPALRHLLSGLIVLGRRASAPLEPR